MKKGFYFTVLLLSVFSTLCKAQSANGITFSIEKLEPPKYLLDEVTGNKMMSDIAPGFLVHSPVPENLVAFGAHPFFNGMYKAYAEHRPFELSPDMMWLLICQGFAQHVNNNSAELRSMFVNFEGKKSLIVKADPDKSLNDIATWEEIIPQFMDKAAESTGKELFDNLTPAFSTTTSVEKVATQITALESVKSFFEYVVITVVCGIPEVTLKGTPEDWKLVLEKARALKKYKLDWWIDEIEPKLEQFIRASEGKVNKSFWRNMFKYHTEKKYGAPKIIDGWIVKFFPYNNKKQRNNLKEIKSSDDLPDERVSVDFKLITVLPGGRTDTKAMQFIAGFTGLKQDRKTMSLCPQISWAVASADSAKSNSDNLEEESRSEFGLWIRVSELPAELLQLKAIHSLKVEFLDSIKIPEAFSLVNIDGLMLTGKISEKEELKIIQLFPETSLSINDHHYTDNDTTLWLSDVGEVPGILKHKQHWRRVFIENVEPLVIPDHLPEMNIERLGISADLSDDDKKKLLSLFPSSEIYVDRKGLRTEPEEQKLARRKQRLLDWQKLNTDK